MPFEEVIGNKMMYSCDACPSVFQMGQGRYEGTHLHELDITVCRACGPEDQSTKARQEAVARLRVRDWPPK